MQNRLLNFLLLTALGLALALSTVHAQSAGSWTMKAPIPTARTEVALAAVGGKIHVIGGSMQNKAVTLHDEYDPATDNWRSRAPLPFALDHIGTAVLNGKIYTVGGFIASVHKDGQPHVLEYDPAVDSWRVLSPLKVGLGSVGVTGLDGKIHAVGGRTPAGIPLPRTKSTIRRSTVGASAPLCQRRVITWRWSPPTGKFMRSADASARAMI